MKIYHNPRCSKSRQALGLLKEHSTDIEIVEYLKDIPSTTELKSLLVLLGISASDLLRKNEAEYKSYIKGKDLNEEELIEAMAKYPKLIERPIVTNGNQAVIGRPPEKVLSLL